MHGLYGYGGYGGFVATASIGLLLGFIAFVAAIVVTVLFYKKYIAIDSTHKAYSYQGLKRDWGPFFRFEHLIVENILKVLYIFIASLIAFESAAVIISSLFSIAIDPGTVFTSVIFAAVVCIVLEVVTRLWFEFSLMTVLIWKNTSAIRKSVAGDEPADPSGAPASNAPVGGCASQQPPQQPMGYQQYGSSYPAAMPQNDVSVQQGYPVCGAATTQSSPSVDVPAPVQPVAVPSSASQPQSSEWVCLHCGATNKAGSYCGQCGHERPH